MGALERAADGGRLGVYRHLYHLPTFVHAGQPLPVDRLLAASTLSAEQQITILAHFAALGSAKLRPIFEAILGLAKF